MNKNLKEKTFSGLFFKTLERLFLQGISLVISIILARLLIPEDYGNVTLILVFITIFDVFISYGIGSTLIQKKEVDCLDYSTCFYSSIIISIVLYLVIFFTAPYVAKFYGNIELARMIRILGIRLLFTGVNSIQNAYIAKNFLFRKSMIITFIATVLSGTAGIIMAYRGYGEWSLIVQSLLSSFIVVVLSFILVKLDLKLSFSLDRLKKLLKFGWKLMAIGLLNCGYDELRSIIIGKKYSTSDLAYYDKGRNFPKLISNNINSIVDGVMYSAMSYSQESIEELKNILSRSIRISLYILAPMLLGLALISDELILLLYTDKWAEAAVYLKIFSLAYICMPIITLNINALKATGKGGLLLIIDLIEKVAGISLIVVSSFYGVFYMACSVLISYIISLFIRMIVAKKVFNYAFGKQLLDIVISIIPAIVMGLSVYLVGFVSLTLVWKLLLKVIIGIFSFLLVSILVKNDSFFYIIRLFKERKKR